MSSELQESIDEKPIQWVTFFLGNEKFGINVMQVQEVLRITEIAPVPGASSYVLGIINLRGNVVTVIDTRNRFGLSGSGGDDNSRIIIIEMDDHIVGMMVDSVAEVAEVMPSAVETAPNTGNEERGKYILGVTNHSNELLILVDLLRMFSAQDVAELEMF
ncbi:MAG: chemotaxis protein CheW [Methylococcaceae bacterium]